MSSSPWRHVGTRMAHSKPSWLSRAWRGGATPRGVRPWLSAAAECWRCAQAWATPIVAAAFAHELLWAGRLSVLLPLPNPLSPFSSRDLLLSPLPPLLLFHRPTLERRSVRPARPPNASGFAFRECLVLEALPATATSIARPCREGSPHLMGLTSRSATPPLSGRRSRRARNALTRCGGRGKTP